MGKHRTILYLATVVLLVFVVCLCFAQRERSGLPFSVWVSAGEKTESISLWESDDGECYVFLPAYAQLEQVRIRLHTGNPVSLDGVQLEEGMLCDVFLPETSYTLSYSTWGMTKQKTVTFLQSASVAAMHIDTQSGSMEFIHEKKGNEETGAMRLYTHEGELDYDGELESINGRGNSTWWDFEKKPYSLKLIEEADLLGMGAAQRWVLLANAGDASHLRNKIVYDFARDVGLAYSPDSQWVDLYLNGEYAGLYLLCERNEVHPERIDLADPNSILVSRQTEYRLIGQNYPYVSTSTGQALRIHNPQEPSAEVMSKIKQTFQSVENALMDENGEDYISKKTWDELIDVDSWVKVFLIDEIFGNVDACYSSLYFYVDTSKSDFRVFAGPVWDYDHSMGSAHIWHIANPNSLYANRLQVMEGTETPWFHNLYYDEAFYDRMVEVYQTEFLPALETCLSTLDRYTEKIVYSVYMDYIRWCRTEKNLYEEVDYLQTFVIEHVGFLNELWINNKEYYKITLDHGDWGFYGYFYAQPGECLSAVPTLTDSDNATFLGWYYKDTNEPFDPDRPITEDIEIYAKWQDKPTKKLDQLLKLVPLGVIAVMGVGLLWVEVKRWKRRR